jgi:hypothetical protein
MVDLESCGVDLDFGCGSLVVYILVMLPFPPNPREP